MIDLAAIERELLAPGGPFETEEALVRGERPGWLAVVAVLLNLTAVLPPLWFFWSKH